MNWRKSLSVAVALTLILSSISLLPDGVQAHAIEKEERSEDPSLANSYTFTDPELYKEAKNLGLSDEEIVEMDKQLEGEIELQSLSVGAIVAIIGAVGITYAGGKYAARSLDKSGIITTKHYKRYRWAYRVAITAALTPIIALGFDDYHYGI